MTKWRAFLILMQDGWFTLGFSVGLLAVLTFSVGLLAAASGLMMVSVVLSVIACGAVIRSYHLELVRARRRTRVPPSLMVVGPEGEAFSFGQVILLSLEDLPDGRLDEQAIDERCAAMARFLDDVNPNDFARR